MQQQKSSIALDQLEKGNHDQKVTRLFDHTHIAEKQRAKELQNIMHSANKNQFFMQVIIMILCGVFAIVCLIEMPQEILRYEYKSYKFLQPIIYAFCFALSGIVAVAAYYFKGNFRRANRSVLIFLAIYMICCQFIIFEISLMCKLYINPLFIILMNQQTKVFTYSIYPSRAHFIYVIIFHILMIYAILRIFLEFQIFQQSTTSSIIVCILLIISLISQMIESKQSQMEKSFRKKLIAAQQGEICNIKKFYTNILQYIPHGIAIIDEQMQILFANSNLHSILNCSKNEDLFQALNKLNLGEVQNLNGFCQPKQQQQSQQQQNQSKLTTQININQIQEKVVSPSCEQKHEGDRQKGKSNRNNQYKNYSKYKDVSQNDVSLNNTMNQINFNNQLIDDSIEIDIKNTSIHQGVQFVELRGDQTISYELEPKCHNKQVSQKFQSFVKIAEQYQSSENPSSSSPNRDQKSSFFKSILEKIFTSSTKQSCSSQRDNQMNLDNFSKSLLYQQPLSLQQPSQKQQNQNINQLQNKGQNNLDYLKKEEPKKITNNIQQSPNVNSRKQSSASFEKTPKQQQINTQSCEKANLYEEEACQIEANSFDGKKLNIKLVLYDLDLEKEVEDAFNSFYQISPLNDSHEKELQIRQKKASLQSLSAAQKQQNINDKIQKDMNKTNSKDLNQKNSQNISQKKQNLQPNQNQKIQVHEQLIFMIIEDQSQAQKVKRLEDQNEYKMRMLASVSHELRTPLNCSISMLQIMREELLRMDQKDMIKDNLDPALYSSKILLNLINDILDFAQLEAGKFKITRQNFSLRKILQECLILISIQSRMKGIKLCLQIGSSIYEEYNSCEQIESAFDPINPLNQQDEKYIINSDPNRVRQIVLNLLSNALKFTNQGQITLKAEITCQKPVAIKITCEDTGIGIPPDRYSTIFDNFNKADLQNRIKYNQCGAGLGLSISNQLAKILCPSELQHQPIVVVSEVGKGSSFSFTIQDYLTEDIQCIKSQQEKKADELQIISEESKKDNDLEHSPKQNKESCRNSLDNNSFQSYQNQKQKLLIKIRQFGKNVGQDIIFEDAVDETNNKFSNQTIFANSNPLQIDNDRATNSDVYYQRQKQESFKKKKEEMSQIDENSQLNDILTQKNIYSDNNLHQISNRKSSSISINQKQNEAFDLNSPTIIEKNKPNYMDVIRNELVEKKRFEEYDCDFSILRQNSPQKMSSHQLNHQFSNQLSQVHSFLKEQTQIGYVSKQNTFDSHQNYMYSYSLSSQLTQQQQIASSCLLNQNEGKDSQKQVTSKSLQLKYVKSHFKSLEEFKSYHKKRKCKHAQVLVVDDNQFNVIAIQQQINKLDLQIDMAFSGESALQKIQERIKNNFPCCPFYLMIFMDIDMPVMNGYETTQLITQVFKENLISSFECPIIACSAYVNPEDKQKAFESGMLDYVTKPIMLGTLDKVFTNWFVQPNNGDQD
ncbi:hypothetical protein ABPG72_001603 [Tetrahymena utriculariae]